VNKLNKLDQLISEVLGGGKLNLELVNEEQQPPLEASKAIPAVPYPKLQLNKNWGKNPSSGLDVSLFQLAGLAQTGSVEERLQRLIKLVDCTAETCPNDVREIIARLSIMEMFSSILTSFEAQSSGYLFENFMALVLKGSALGGTVIQDIEILTDEEDLPTKPVSLKLLADGKPIKGSIDNLYKTVIEEGRPVIYIIGYKAGSKGNPTHVDLKYFTIDEEFFKNKVVIKGKTLMTIAQERMSGAENARSQFYIANAYVHAYSKQQGGTIGMLPIYSAEQLREKADILTEALNVPVFEIYESLNLFSQLLTKLYIENDHSAGTQARSAFDRLSTAVEQDEKLK